MMPVKYPQHEKLATIQDRSQTVGEFLEWLYDDLGIRLAYYDDDDGNGLVEYRLNTQRLLADFFGIDYDELQREKDAMFEEMRAAWKS